MNRPMDRRRFIGMAASTGAAVLVSGCSHTAGTKGSPERAEGEEEQVTPGEDLMREHGVLRRVLLIYEEVDRRSQAGNAPMSALGDASGIVRSFVEDYHEKLEEEFVFPRFQKENREIELVRTLKTQHDAGRRITSRVMSIAGSKTLDSRTRPELSTLIGEFIRMYRPHAAREDTVLFREFPEIVGTSDYRALGERFEEREHELFGEAGFAGIVDKVAAIEKTLGIYELAQFTPRART